MADRDWSKAVQNAVSRYVMRTGSPLFTRQELIDAELDSIVAETGSAGSTPQQTLSRELQQLRDAGALEFIGGGAYRWRGDDWNKTSAATSKGVFVIESRSSYDDEPERFYRFGSQWRPNAAKVVGTWIIYFESPRAGPRGYYAVAKVDQIIPDPTVSGMFLALIESGSYLEFGRDVPFQIAGRAVESGLLSFEGRLNNERAVQSIRTVSDADFNRIVELGLIDEEEFLPRVDAVDEARTDFVMEEQQPWEGPIDRSTMLVSRTVRDRQFRKRVLDVYDKRCALTGIQLINGGGRPEAQAAHIMSVGAGGPDVVTNGIALSGTVHWMFDRGLISIADDGEILLSRQINDVESAERLIYRDRRARLPASIAHRPHRRYLEWHRSKCFKDAV